MSNPFANMEITHNLNIYEYENPFTVIQAMNNLNESVDVQNDFTSFIKTNVRVNLEGQEENILKMEKLVSLLYSKNEFDTSNELNSNIINAIKQYLPNFKSSEKDKTLFVIPNIIGSNKNYKFYNKIVKLHLDNKSNPNNEIFFLDIIPSIKINDNEFSQIIDKEFMKLMQYIQEKYSNYLIKLNKKDDNRNPSSIESYIKNIIFLVNPKGEFETHRLFESNKLSTKQQSIIHDKYKKFSSIKNIGKQNIIKEKIKSIPNITFDQFFLRIQSLLKEGDAARNKETYKLFFNYLERKTKDFLTQVTKKTSKVISKDDQNIIEFIIKVHNIDIIEENENFNRIIANRNQTYELISNNEDKIYRGYFTKNKGLNYYFNVSYNDNLIIQDFCKYIRKNFNNTLENLILNFNKELRKTVNSRDKIFEKIIGIGLNSQNELFKIPTGVNSEYMSDGMLNPGSIYKTKVSTVLDDIFYSKNTKKYMDVGFLKLAFIDPESTIGYSRNNYYFLENKNEPYSKSNFNKYLNDIKNEIFYKILNVDVIKHDTKMEYKIIKNNNEVDNGTIKKLLKKYYYEKFTLNRAHPSYQETSILKYYNDLRFDIKNLRNFYNMKNNSKKTKDEFKKLQSYYLLQILTNDDLYKEYYDYISVNDKKFIMARNISDIEKKKFENSIINSIVDIIFETGNVFYLYERSESNSEEKRFKEENIGKGRNNYHIISYKKNKQIDTIQLKNVHDVSEHFYDANRENVDMRHKLDLDLFKEMIKNKGDNNKYEYRSIEISISKKYDDKNVYDAQKQACPSVKKRMKKRTRKLYNGVRKLVKQTTRKIRAVVVS
jgi:hypothetical protein